MSETRLFLGSSWISPATPLPFRHTLMIYSSRGEQYSQEKRQGHCCPCLVAKKPGNWKAHYFTRIMGMH